MKLYLSSRGIPDSTELLALSSKPPSQVRTGVITNAYDLKTNEYKIDKFGRVTDEFRAFGVNPEQIDLQTFNSQTELESRLREFDILWAIGGNSFYLRYMMRQSGFDRMVKGLVESGIVYGGESAGAIVIGPTLRGIQHIDNPAGVPTLIWDGVGLTDFMTIPHWRNEKYHHGLVAARKELSRLGIVDLAIDDQKAIIIEGNRRRVI